MVTAHAEINRFEMETRMERALRFGRVTGEGTPNFVGAWKQGMASGEVSGTFELFIDKTAGSKISGRIEDVLGTATFEGEIVGDSIMFTKTYTKRLDSWVAQGGIEYAGKRGADGRFSGKFHLLSPDKIDPAPDGTFEMGPL